NPKSCKSASPLAALAQSRPPQSLDQRVPPSVRTSGDGSYARDGGLRGEGQQADEHLARLLEPAQMRKRRDEHPIDRRPLDQRGPRLLQPVERALIIALEKAREADAAEALESFRRAGAQLKGAAVAALGLIEVTRQHVACPG